VLFSCADELSKYLVILGPAPTKEFLNEFIPSLRVTAISKGGYIVGIISSNLYETGSIRRARRYEVRGQSAKAAGVQSHLTYILTNSS
jgi:hypothetical protein